jgi:uncharacterized protein YndB with AHSA1/START domain
MSTMTLVRRIVARPSIVFDALSTAEGMTSWWGPADVPVIAAVADVRVGGTFRVRFRTDDGKEHECAGKFLDIVRPQHIVMSWYWAEGGEPQEAGAISRVELRLRPIDTGTELTLIHAALQNEISARSHEWGWTGALDKLERRFVESRGTSLG